MTNDPHEVYMNRCIELAQQAMDLDNPPVGAILVYKGKIIGEGIELAKSTGDVTHHAEILAVRDALMTGHIKHLHQTTLYTTHEPCIMCSYVIRHHKIPIIVFGMSVDHIGGYTSDFKILCTNEIPKWGSAPQVLKGICKDRCLALSAEYNKRE